MVTDFFRDQQASKQQYLEETFLKRQGQQRHGYDNSSCFFPTLLWETMIHVRKHMVMEN